MITSRVVRFGPSGWRPQHHVWFNEPCGISMDELLETSSHLKVFIQSKAKTRHVFGSKFNCLEQLLGSLHWSLVTGTFRARDVNFLWFLRRLVPLGSRCRATPKRRNPRRSMALRKHQAHPGAVPFPHHESQVKPRRVDPLTE